MLVMVEVQFTTSMTAKCENFAYLLLPRNQVTETHMIVKIALIPAYFVHDGFKKDLHTGLVYLQAHTKA